MYAGGVVVSGRAVSGIGVAAKGMDDKSGGGGGGNDDADEAVPLPLIPLVELPKVDDDDDGAEYKEPLVAAMGLPVPNGE